MSEDPKTVVRESAMEPAPMTATVVTMPAWQMVLVRAARTYIQALLGFLTASQSGLAAAVGIPIGEFGNQFYVAATLAVAPTVIAFLMNLGEILSDLDVNRPRLRA